MTHMMAPSTERTAIGEGASALGRQAYLRALLDAAGKFLHLDGKPIGKVEDWLEKNFLQNFKALADPAGGAEANRPVRQLTVSCEVFLKYLRAERVTIREDAGWVKAYGEVAYRRILTEIGTSPDEIEVALRDAEAGQVAHRDALADRLGLLPQDLAKLACPEGGLSESKLAELFGWRPLLGDKAGAAAKPLLAEWREARTRTQWAKEDFGGADQGGWRPVVDPEVIDATWLKPERTGNGQRDKAVRKVADLLAARRDALDGLRRELDNLLSQPGLTGEQAVARLTEMSGGKRAAMTPAEAEWLTALATRNRLTGAEKALVRGMALKAFRNARSAEWLKEESDILGSGEPLQTGEWFQFPAQSPESREDGPSRQQWVRRLKERIAMPSAVAEAIRQAVHAAEGEVLPGFVGELAKLVPSGRDSRGRPVTTFLSQKFVIQVEASPAVMTTRLEHATLRLQSLLGEARWGGGDWPLSIAGAEIDAFDKHWTSLETYDVWRAAETVRLFPENVLLPALLPIKSPAFTELLGKSRGGRTQIDEWDGMAAGLIKFIYDLGEGPTDHTISTASMDVGGQTRTFIFFSPRSDHSTIYWMSFAYEPNATPKIKDPSPWRSIALPAQVRSLLGAEAHTVEGTDHICLFAISEEALCLYAVLVDPSGGEPIVNTIAIDKEAARDWNTCIDVYQEWQWSERKFVFSYRFNMIDVHKEINLQLKGLGGDAKDGAARLQRFVDGYTRGFFPTSQSNDAPFLCCRHDGERVVLEFVRFYLGGTDSNELNNKGFVKLRSAPEVTVQAAIPLPPRVFEQTGPMAYRPKRKDPAKAFADWRAEARKAYGETYDYFAEAMYHAQMHRFALCKAGGAFKEALKIARSLEDLNTNSTSLYPSGFGNLRDQLEYRNNPHCLAQPEHYRAFVLLSAARCMIAEGDLEFARNTDESLSRARQAYFKADLVLRDLKEVNVPRPDVGPYVLSPNPVVAALEQHVALNLRKLREGRNIAGLEQPCAPVAMAGAGSAGGLPAQGTSLPISPNPTTYRYAVLIERARQLAQMAAQIEANLLSAFEKRDAEAYNILRARLDMSLSRTSIDVQDIRLREADHNLALARSERERADVQVTHYRKLIDDGLSTLEKTALNGMCAAAFLEISAGLLNFTAACLPSSISAGFPSGVSTAASPQSSTQAVAGGMSNLAAAANTAASAAATTASFDRRREEWMLQKQVAEKDVAISLQRLALASDQKEITQAEHKVVSLRADNDAAMLEFLATKFTNAELYEWMSRVLEGVYRYFLTQGGAVAQMAAAQLAFERQIPVPPIIRADYWDVRGEHGGKVVDRHGLTGSARLLQDIQRLDDYAFASTRRRQEITRTIALGQVTPVEFAEFRRSGELRFRTPLELFDRDFPGHYLRLIHRVRISVIGLVPAVESIKATLRSAGISRVVKAAEDGFTEVVLTRPPEEIALSAARDATGTFELSSGDMLRPFEGMGVDTHWCFSLPKPANAFDFNGIVDVLMTIEYTALASDEYRAEVVKRLQRDNRFVGDRAFSLRRDLPDLWYRLVNDGKGRSLPLQVRNEHFPPHLGQGLTVQNVAVLLVGDVPGGAAASLSLRDTSLGKAEALQGVISSRQPGRPWAGVVAGLGSPVGTWDLTLEGEGLEAALKSGALKDVLFVVTYAASGPAWVA